jgi:hypothetical protein
VGEGFGIDITRKRIGELIGLQRAPVTTKAI